MQPIKLIIELTDGVIQAVYGNADLRYIIVDRDQISHGKNPVSSPLKPDALTGELFTLYEADTDPEQEIREALKRAGF